MSAEVFLDSNVVIYMLDSRDERRETATRLISAGAVISSQVLSETANVARRKLHFDYPAIARILAEVMRTCPVLPVSAETVHRALLVAERYGFSYFDSLIVASARLAGCKILYSEDLQHRQTIDSELVILNPFLS